MQYLAKADEDRDIFKPPVKTGGNSFQKITFVKVQNFDKGLITFINSKKT